MDRRYGLWTIVIFRIAVTLSCITFHVNSNIFFNYLFKSSYMPIYLVFSSNIGILCIGRYSHIFLNLLMFLL